MLRTERAPVLLHFRADDTYRSDARTKQLGFAASWFDSTLGACVRDCSGHGSCEDGFCACDEGYGADKYTDCSLEVRTLEDGAPLEISGLEVGEWNYFKVVVEEPKQTFLVELADRSDAMADPRLMFSTDTLPTLSHYRFSDWFNWSRAARVPRAAAAPRRRTPRGGVAARPRTPRRRSEATRRRAPRRRQRSYAATDAAAA